MCAARRRTPGFVETLWWPEKGVTLEEAGMGETGVSGRGGRRDRLIWLETWDLPAMPP
jgi:hypothetical protein